MTDIERLIQIFEQEHGSKATHRESVPVQEEWNGETPWEGVVEVFDLEGHFDAKRAYGWARETNNPKQPRRYVIVLHERPTISPMMAVRTSITRDYYYANQKRKPWIP